MEVRYAQKEELPQVNRLRRQVHELHCQGRPDIFRDGFCDALQQHVYDIFEKENAGVIAALSEGAVQGFAIVEYIDRPMSAYNLPRRYCHVEEFGVDEAHRRQGVATALLEFIKEDALARGFEKIELDMWEFNQGALGFYESAGFTTFRRLMELPLTKGNS
ncbi:MAG: GNAT family N-acetyltransferase [Candidatus Faecousia sp.]|nr:GNAT family N-acetyltransferase [Bacillota bacterium]MDY4219842.1 GNAT family N-acetyltransferase [Candidatus Faecousia sp.]